MITVQASMDGILLGVLFCFNSIWNGLSMGVMNIINIVQGDLVILGGYIAYFMYIYGIHPCVGSNSFTNNYVFCWCWNLQISN